MLARAVLGLCAATCLAGAGPADAAPKRADLRPSASSAPADVAVGRAFVVRDTTVNAGRRAARASENHYFLSLDARFGSDVRIEGRRSIAALRARKRSKGTTMLLVPPIVAPGAYRLLVCADATRKVRESNEKNNCAPAQQTVRVASGSIVEPTPTPAPTTTVTPVLTATPTPASTATVIATPTPPPDPNDPPTVAIGQIPTVTEDVDTTLATDRIQIDDVDAGQGDLAATIASPQAPVTLATTAGLNFSQGDGFRDTNARFTGTLSEIRAALTGLKLRGVPDDATQGTLRIDLDDQGNTGQGGARTATATSAPFAVQPVNDAPVVALSGAGPATEDTTFSLGSGGQQLIRIFDEDSQSTPLLVTVTADRGSASLGSTAGVTFSQGDGVNDPVMTFAGTLETVNVALDGASFTPEPNANGPAGVRVQVSDQGDVGQPAQTDDETLAINLAAVNDGPTASAGPDLSANEDTDIDLPATYFAIGDVDAGSGNFEATLAGAGTVIGLKTKTGVVLSDPDGDASTTFRGSLEAVRTVLADVRVRGALDENGRKTITLTVSDLGNTGAGGTKTASDAFDVVIAPINDAPRVSLFGNGSAATDEDVPLVIAPGTPNAITFSDDQDPTSDIFFSVTVTNGTLTLARAPQDPTFGDGTNDARIDLNTSLNELAQLFDGATIRPAAEFSGTAQVAITIRDEVGADRQVNGIVTVAPVADPPIITAPDSATATEDTDLRFDGPRTISVTNPDEGSYQANLIATGGINEVTFPGIGAFGGREISFSASAQDMRSILATYRFRPDADRTQQASVRIRIVEADPSGVTTTAEKTVQIPIIAVNDAPTVDLPNQCPVQSTGQTKTCTFSSANNTRITVADVDAGSAVVEAAFFADEGLLNLSRTDGLVFLAGDGTNDPSMTFRGTLADINAALDGARHINSVGAVNNRIFLGIDDLGNSPGPAMEALGSTITTAGP